MATHPSRFLPRLALILFAAAVLYLVGNQTVGLWDRDEPRYAQCTREMIQSGDWIVPRQLGDWRLEKPPLIYWCQAAVMEIAGDTDFSARLPSALAVLGTALLLALAVRRHAGEKRALWSAFIFCSAGLVIASAKMCITDALLMFLVFCGQVCLGIMWINARKNRPTHWAVAPLFWISTGLAGLTKGPQVVGMHAVTLLALLLLDMEGRRWKDRGCWLASARWWRRMQPLVGIPILAVVVAPWMIAIHRQAPGFLYELFHKVGMHTASSMEGHGNPPGYHLLLIFGTFFPWSLLLPTAITLAYLHRRSPMVRFAIAATVGPWLLMEMVWTKLPFYVLPAFPGLAFLTADALVRCIRRQHKDLLQPAFLIAAIVWSDAALGLGIAPWLSALVSNKAPVISCAVFTAGGLVYAGVVLYLVARQKFHRAALAMGIGMILMVGWLYGAVLPRFDFLRLSIRLGQDLRQAGAYGSDVPLIMVGYHEDSLPWYQGGSARQADSDDYFNITPPDRWPKWVTINQELWDRAPASARERYDVIAKEHGLNYAFKGQQLDVLILKKK